jgi:two-component system, NarL family, response regulator
MKSAPISVLVVDDHFMIRLGLVSALSQENDLKIVGGARNGREALDMFESFRPDVTLMDGILPDMHGVEVTRSIVASHPEARIILISINETAEDIHRAMEAGAWGYLPKSSEHRLLLEAIRSVASGERFLPPEIRTRLAERSLYGSLSERELEVLRLVAKGKANKEIAEELGVGEGTIKTHLKHLLSKLDAPDRTRAVTLAIERGLLRL